MRNLEKTEKDKNKIDLLICLLVVILLFIPTLARPFLIYDERIISEGIYFTAPTSLSEIFEIIEKFGLNFNIVSANTLYSTNSVTRTSPLGQVFWLFLNLFFQRIPFFYHAFNLTLHLLNTCLIYFILKTFINQRFLIILLALIWAIHPTMIESVMLATNAGALLSYSFFFFFLLDFLKNKDKNRSIIRESIIPILFLIPMLMNEYIVTLPFVLFVISFQETYKHNSFKKAFRKSLDETKPYFIGFVIYVLYYLFFSSHRINQIYEENQMVVLFERIFWLAPQIFFHLLVLLLYPRTLSIDQTVFVRLGNKITDPYSIFCIIFLSCWLLVPLLIFICRKKLSNTFLLSWTFFFGLLPFLHILAPSYTLATERYLYCPFALVVVCTAKILSSKSGYFSSKILPIILSLLLISYSARSYIRTLDWRSDEAFINSSYKVAKEHLFKAMRLGMLAKVISVTEPSRLNEVRKKFINTLSLLEKAKKEIKLKEKKYQKSLPSVLKSYGLDYRSLLTKVAFLEATTLYIELKQDYKIALKVLGSSIKDPKKTDPRILQLYSHLLIQDKRYKEAKKVLLIANKNYPHTPFVLLDLIEFSTKYDNDKEEAEKYLLDALRYNIYDPMLLLKAVDFYKEIKNPALAAKYAYLYSLRTHSINGYLQALVNSLNADQLKDAKKSVDKLARINLADPEILYFTSKYYYKVKNYQKAQAILYQAYISSKQKGVDNQLAFDISHALAKLYLFLGEKEKAILVTKDTQHLAENNLEELKKLAILYKSLGLKDNFSYCLNRIQLLSRG